MITLNGISKNLREPNLQWRPLFQELEFQLRDDDRSVAIVGRSGSGKTTLLRMIAGLDTNYDGEYLIDGVAVARTPAAMAAIRREHIGFVTQHYDLLPDRTVLNNVVFGCAKRADTLNIARASLARVGLAGFERHRVSRLSGGEAQRVAIARALTKQPRVILADEPTGALDESTESELLSLFDELADQGTHFVVATHSAKVAGWCQRTLAIHGGRLVTAEAGDVS